MSQSTIKPQARNREGIQAALDHLLDELSRRHLAPQILGQIAAEKPDLFFAAAMERLQAPPTSPGQGKQSLQLLDVPEFLLQLASPERLSREDLLRFCQQMIQQDPLLDVKLARLLPGRHADPYDLGADGVVHLMDVLDALSPGPRLTMTIGHLTKHGDRRIASKAALLIGRRLHNRGWVEAQLASPDARVRSNVVEALWGERTTLALETFRRCVEDENNRVIGNALVGLYLVEEPGLGPRIRRLLEDARPAFRLTGVWVIEKTRDPSYAQWLEAAQTDVDPGVAEAALKALESLKAGQPEAS